MFHRRLTEQSLPPPKAFAVGLHDQDFPKRERRNRGNRARHTGVTARQVRLALGSRLVADDFLWNSFLEKLQETLFRHPPGTFEMTLQGALRARRLIVGLDAQDDPSHLDLACPFRLGVKEPKVGDEMLLVVFRYAIRPRDLVGDRRVEFGLGHDFAPCASSLGTAPTAPTVSLRAECRIPSQRRLGKSARRRTLSPMRMSELRQIVRCLI